MKNVRCDIRFTAPDGEIPLSPLTLIGLTVERALELRRTITQWLLRAPDVTATWTEVETQIDATTGSEGTLGRSDGSGSEGL